MSQKSSIESLLNVARQTVDAAPCATIITLGKDGHPSARSVAAFPPDDDFSSIVVGSHPNSRKSKDVVRDSRVTLSYVDGPNRGYLTVIGRARVEEDPERRQTYWVDRFEAFFPDGPTGEGYHLLMVEPERLELRSFGLGVAAEPTRWSPVILDKNTDGRWTQAN